ncbi:putative Transposon TX1 [Sesbania bispinosa]|nr:putative Transposon TX1 [Sesbania bispinosa]
MVTSPDVQMDPKPPDDAHAEHKVRASFKDTLVGSKSARYARERLDLIGNKLFRIEYENGDRLKPRCYVADTVQDRNSKDSPNPDADLGINKLTINNVDPGMAKDTINSPNPDADSSHGEWLVVSRIKKSSKATGKGTSQVKGSSMAGGNGKVPYKTTTNNNVSGKKVPQGVKVNAHPVSKNQALPTTGKNNNSKFVSDPMVFTSTTLPITDQSITRKKRYRVDPPLQISTTNVVDTNLDLPKFDFPSSSRIQNTNVKTLDPKDPPHGIKTMLNVDIITGNRLRFRDEDGSYPISSNDSSKEIQPHDSTNHMDADMDMKARTIQQESQLQGS